MASRRAGMAMEGMRWQHVFVSGKTCNKNPHIHTHTATHSRTRIDVGKYINRVYISINYFNPCCTLLYASTAWAQDFFRVPKFGNPSCDIHAMHHRACFCFCYFMLFLARDFPTPLFFWQELIVFIIGCNERVRWATRANVRC